MKAAIFLILFLTSNYAGAAPVSTVTCDSYMEYGLVSFHEQGTFTYVASPLKVSIQLKTGEIILTDSTHLCQVTRTSIQYASSVQGDASSGLDITLTSQPNGDNGDGGHISLGGNDGSFTCAYLPNGASIELSNCSVK